MSANKTRCVPVWPQGPATKTPITFDGDVEAKYRKWGSYSKLKRGSKGKGKGKGKDKRKDMLSRVSRRMDQSRGMLLPRATVAHMVRKFTKNTPMADLRLKATDLDSIHRAAEEHLISCLRAANPQASSSPSKRAIIEAKDFRPTEDITSTAAEGSQKK